MAGARTVQSEFDDAIELTQGLFGVADPETQNVALTSSATNNVLTSPKEGATSFSSFDIVDLLSLGKGLC